MELLLLDRFYPVVPGCFLTELVMLARSLFSTSLTI